MRTANIAGNALSWHYIARNGGWAALPIDHSGPAAGTTVNARLSEAQFARLIEDSEADEIWVRLQYGWAVWDGLPSERYYLLSQVVQIARKHQLGNTATFRWCARLIDEIGIDTGVNVAQAFFNLENEFIGKPNEELQNTV
jgi:hypothetical protein